MSKVIDRAVQPFKVAATAVAFGAGVVWMLLGTS